MVSHSYVLLDYKETEPVFSSLKNSPGITVIEITINHMLLEDIANEISILCKRTLTN